MAPKRPSGVLCCTCAVAILVGERAVVEVAATARDGRVLGWSRKQFTGGARHLKCPEGKPRKGTQP